MGSRCLISLKEGTTKAVCWLSLDQDCDFGPMFDKLQNDDKKKIAKRIQWVIEGKATNNKENFRSLGDGIWEMKAGQIRLTYCHHRSIKDLIVLLHMFIKKNQKTPPEEIKRARKRRDIADTIDRLTE